MRKRLATLIKVFLVLSVVSVVVAGAVYRWRIEPELDSLLENVPNYVPPSTCRILDKDGNEIDSFYVERRVWMPLDRISPWIPRAVIAAEDQRYRTHPGVDLAGILRALAVNLRSGRAREGGSTLTQQLVKNLVVGNERSLSRKVREAALALRLERKMSKDRILELYLNYVYLGSGNYGVEAAARDYFGIPAAEVDAAQAALLASLISAPSRRSPRRSPHEAMTKRSRVLLAMSDLRMLSPQIAARLAVEPVDPPRREGRGHTIGAAYLTSVRREVRRLFGRELPSSTGMVVHTPYDPNVQIATEIAIRSAVDGVLQRRADRRNLDRNVNGAAVVIENDTGHVVALAGGVEMGLEGFNRATQARRQPGSAFKPFVYATALADGRTQITKILDAPVTLDAGDQRYWRPRNTGGLHRGWITMRKALAKSVNVTAVRLAHEAGVRRVIDVARGLGVRSEIRRDLTIALGSSELSPMDIAVAYTSIARLGRATDPVFIARLENARGDILGRAGEQVTIENRPMPYQNAAGGSTTLRLPGPTTHQVISSTVAYQLIDMMREVVRSGTGRAARELNRDVAGKTGTTNGIADTWFAGMTPTHTIVVWIGSDGSRESLGPWESGGYTALPAWSEIVRSLPPTSRNRFPMPDELAMVWNRGQWVAVPRAQIPQRYRMPKVSGRRPLQTFPTKPWYGPAVNTATIAVAREPAEGTSE